MLSKVLFILPLIVVVEAFLPPTTSIGSMDKISTRTRMIDPTSITTAAAEASAEFVPDFGEIFRNGFTGLALFGGLIPATISANSAMIKALSGRKGYIPEGEEPGPDVETFENFDPNNSEF